jgi:hypothetical protein
MHLVSAYLKIIAALAKSGTITLEPCICRHINKAFKECQEQHPFMEKVNIYDAHIKGTRMVYSMRSRV